MTTRYRVEYALKTHRRDQLIEWIKGLLAVPFVLHSQPTAAYDGSHQDVLQTMAVTAHRRYAEIFQDVEGLINDHIAHEMKEEVSGPSKLKHLVPSIGKFFTPLALEKAFEYQDQLRRISFRRFVAPSFNDIRLILNSAQIISLAQQGPLELVTFDGDVTLYEDGQSLTPENPVIPRILNLLARGIKVGIVTAAGYTEAEKYAERLRGLLEAIQSKLKTGQLQAKSFELVIMGGESSYLFAYDESAEHLLRYIPRSEWQLPTMSTWTDAAIASLLDTAESALRGCIATMNLPAQVVRKERAVGIVPLQLPTPSATSPVSDVPAPPPRFTREQLEETVLVTQQVLETTMATGSSAMPFCAFNGGNDVFVDIGDKSWGVLGCQRFLNNIPASKTLHVGDQFLSAGANDFKARNACTTAWIASPGETVALLDELVGLLDAAGSGSGSGWRDWS